MQSERTHGLKGSNEARTANAAAPRKRRPEEEAAASGDSGEAAGGADAAVAGSTVVEAGTASSGIGSLGLVALGGLGLFGVAAAAAGGGGGKDATPAPPVRQLPDRLIPQQPKPDAQEPQAPKPEEPKPAEPKPVEPTPEQPKPVEPQPEAPKPIEPAPEQPKPVDPVEPMPEPPKPEPKPDVTPPVVTPPEVTPPVVTPPIEPTTPPTPNPVDPAPEQSKPETPPPDTTSPAKPELALKNDTGEAGDNITSDGTISVSGLEEGASWRYSEDGGKTWHQGEGTEIPASRFGGKREVQVIQVDRAGNESKATNLQYTLDTGAPTAALRNDSARLLRDDALGKRVSEGRHLHDDITNDATVTLTGIKEGATWMYSLDEGATWKQGSGTEIAASEFGADGQKTVWTKQMVTTTAESGVSTFSFVLDTHVAPLVPRLKHTDSVGPDGNPVTSDPVLLFDGYEEGAAVKFSVQLPAGSTTSETFIGASEVPLALSPGKYSYFLCAQLDEAGNENDTNTIGPLAFTVIAPNPLEAVKAQVIPPLSL